MESSWRTLRDWVLIFTFIVFGRLWFSQSVRRGKDQSTQGLCLLEQHPVKSVVLQTDLLLIPLIEKLPDYGAIAAERLCER